MSDDLGLTVKDCEAKKVPVTTLNKIGEFLREHPGAKLHAFRSGGGLRVVRIDEQGNQSEKNLLAYGEHPHLDTAIEYLAEDIEAGGRKYSEVYGKIYDHYLTGTHDVSSPLDRWVLGGRSFDIWYEDGKYHFDGEHYHQRPIPKYIQEVVAGSDCVVTWNADGNTFEASPFTFPGNGAAGCTVKQLKGEGKSSFEERHYSLTSGVSIAYFIQKIEMLLTGLLDEDRKNSGNE